MFKQQLKRNLIHFDLILMSDALRGMLVNTTNEVEEAKRRDLAVKDLTETLDLIRTEYGDQPELFHAVKNLRNLEPAEALRLAEKICEADAEAAARVCAKLSAMAARAYSVAQVYRACA